MGAPTIELLDAQITVQETDGAVGPTGAAGSDGDDGLTGNTGATGAAGAAGPEIVFSADENTSTTYDFSDNTTNCSLSGCPLWHKADIDNELIDTASNYDVSTSRFTPTTAGKYKLHAKIGGNAIYSGSSYGGAGQFIEVRIIKNETGTTSGTTTAPSGTIVAQNYYTAPDAGHVNHASVETGGIVDANGSTDHFEVWFVFKNVEHTNGTNKTIDAAFDGFLIQVGPKGNTGAAGAQVHGAAGHQRVQPDPQVQTGQQTVHDGSDGDDGSTGSTGPTGAAGAAGSDGSRWFDGSDR